jgi:hypothetical protein
MAERSAEKMEYRTVDLMVERMAVMKDYLKVEHLAD